MIICIKNKFCPATYTHSAFPKIQAEYQRKARLKFLTLIAGLLQQLF